MEFSFLLNWSLLAQLDFSLCVQTVHLKNNKRDVGSSELEVCMIFTSFNFYPTKYSDNVRFKFMLGTLN